MLLLPGQIETVEERAIRKREELEFSLKIGIIHDPVITPILIFAALHPVLYGIAATVAISVASYGLSRLMSSSSKPPVQQIGKMTGSLSLQNSEQGLFIVEVYGAGENIAVASGTTPTWHNGARVSAGANGSITKISGSNFDWDAVATTVESVNAGEDAFIEFTPSNMGDAFAGWTTHATLTPSTASFAEMTHGLAWTPGGLVNLRANGEGIGTVGHWQLGDTFRVEIRKGNLRVYKKSVFWTEFGIGARKITSGFPLYGGITCFNSGSGISYASVKINDIGDEPGSGLGGVKIGPIIVWTSGLRKVESTTTTSVGGKGHQTQTTTTTTYNIDVAMMGPRGEVDLLREYGNTDILLNQDPSLDMVSGVYNPSVGADSDYDAATPPSALEFYSTSSDRQADNLQSTDGGDGSGGTSGPIQGGSSEVTIYPGSMTQDVDPTIEASVDAKFGPGSTPAYRGRSLVVHTQLQLARWQGILPNLSQVWQHRFLKTISAICQSFGPRVGLNSGNDPTMNIAISNDTCTGLTNVLTSRNITEGSLTNLQVETITVVGIITTTGVARVRIQSEGMPNSPKTLSVGVVLADNASAVATKIRAALVADTDVNGFFTIGGSGADITLTTQLLRSSDFDFTMMTGLKCRGLLISGARFAPADIMDSQELQTVYNYFLTEADELIIGYENGNEPALVIDDTEVGWLESDAETPDDYSLVDVSMADESTLSKECDVKFFDPGNDWDINMQPSFRRTGGNNNPSLVEVQATLLPAEARAAGQRKLYRDYVAGTSYKFTLSWKYLYIYPGYKITINGSDGFTYILRLTSMSGGIGIIECEGEALEPAIFTQLAVGSHPPIYNPALFVPGMTILSLLDIPIFRPEDPLVPGRYWGATPRTHPPEQVWYGSALFMEKQNSYGSPISTTRTAAIIGTVVSATALEPDPDTTDNAGVITVDLYGTEASLESVVEADMIDGLNRAVAGQMVFGFGTATQLTNYPNRWELSVLRTGQNGTLDHTADDFTDVNFVLLNDAIQFVPMLEEELNTTFNYKAPSVGQSLSDSAIVTFNCTGQSVRGPLPHDGVMPFDSVSGDALPEWEGTEAIGPSTQESYDLEIRDDTDTSTLYPQVINPLATSTIGDQISWIIVDDIDGVMTLLENSGIDAVTSGVTAIADSIGTASPKGGLLFDFQIPDSGKVAPILVTIYPEDELYSGLTYRLNWICTQEHDPITGVLSGPFYMYPETSAAGSIGQALKHPALSGDRPYIYLRPDGICEYGINYLGRNTRPIYTSARAIKPSTHYKVSVVSSSAAPNPAGVGIRNPRWLRKQPSWRFTIDMQRRVYGLGSSDPGPDPILARVRQHSFFGGPPSAWLPIIGNR